MMINAQQTDEELPLAKFIEIVPNGDGSGIAVYRPGIISWRQPRNCAWCLKIFTPIGGPSSKLQKFCGKSCSAKWRMRQPENVARVHTKEIHAVIGKKKSEWYKTPAAEKELERIKNLNPMSDPKVREKVSKKLREMKHAPKNRGGNGKPLTVPQQILLESLEGNWVPELAISLGKRKEGYPTCYKVDLANEIMMIAIEVDGNSHYSRKTQDAKKDEMLTSLGWRVVRIWNNDVIKWLDSGMSETDAVSIMLSSHRIKYKKKSTVGDE
jgi:hypothetical protein